MHLLLLIVWIAIAALLRFANLETKPVWADEFSTLVFSLGNGYFKVPLDQVISWNELLQPLQPDPQATVQSVIQRLLTESNHPPLYFILSHLWLNLFPLENGFVSVWAARALSALFGVAAVPATFGFAWLAFRSQQVSHLAAILMAVSPFGIYLAQEARHYTLAVLWILASLSCWVVAARCIRDNRQIPIWLCLIWIVVNGLGIATHYFFLLTLLAEAIALIVWIVFSSKNFVRAFREMPIPSAIPILSLPQLPRLAIVVLGTVATLAVWLPFLLNIRGTELTRWLQSGEFDRSTWLDQLLRPIAAVVTMLYLPPIQGVVSWVAIGSVFFTALLLVLTTLLLYLGWQIQAQNSETRSTLYLLSAFVGSALALTFTLTFGFGMNFTSVFRYQFIYCPGVILLYAVCLSSHWDSLSWARAEERVDRGIASPAQPSLNPGMRFWLGSKKIKLNGKSAIALVLLFSLLGGVTVAADFGYQRTHRPDQVATAIHQSFQRPILVAIPHKTHAHTSRLMAIAWELHRISPPEVAKSSFLLPHYTNQDVTPAIATLEKALQTLPRPSAVWRINFRSQANSLSQAALRKANCTPTSKLDSVDGYRYQQYDCQ